MTSDRKRVEGWDVQAPSALVLIRSKLQRKSMRLKTCRAAQVIPGSGAGLQLYLKFALEVTSEVKNDLVGELRV